MNNQASDENESIIGDDKTLMRGKPPRAYHGIARTLAVYIERVKQLLLHAIK